MYLGKFFFSIWLTWGLFSIRLFETEREHGTKKSRRGNEE